jgi:uncharacterized membrane protein YqjE
MTNNHHPPGLAGSARRLADNALAAVQTRIELFALELREEKTSAIELLIWVCTALFFGMMAVIALTATIVLLFPAEKRVFVAGGFALLYLIGGIWAFTRVKARLKEQGTPFSESINEFKRDREWLQPK